MNTLKYNLLTLWIIFIFAQAPWVYSYPPDNAAVLYYKAMTLYHPDDAASKLMVDFGQGRIKSNDQIREFVVQEQTVVQAVTDAGNIERCDWGLNLREGINLHVPHLGRLRSLAMLMIADAKLLADQDKCPEAISRCMSIYRMARHANDALLISYLVGNAIHRQANEALIELLSQMSKGSENLTLLKTQLAVIDGIPFSIKPALESERSMALSELLKTPEDALHLLEISGLKDEHFKNKIRSFDQAMLDRNISYGRDYMNGVIAAFDMPYTEGCDTISSLTQKAKDDVRSKPEATLTAAVVSTFYSDGVIPPYSKVFSNMILLQTQDNAIRTAVEVYLIKARTGSLPEELPDGLAGDLFSGKPFAYEKTRQGFSLICQGKDLSNGETYKYKFKIK